jgi:hypothetical protein
MSSNVDYPYIRKNGQNMGSNLGWIKWQVEQARADDAPQNATYQRDGIWHTTDEILPDDARARYGLEPLPSHKLPSTYNISIDLDWWGSAGATLTVTRAGFRKVYGDRFGSVQEAADRAVFEIKADQSPPE